MLATAEGIKIGNPAALPSRVVGRVVICFEPDASSPFPRNFGKELICAPDKNPSAERKGTAIHAG
jgi:hypothetical protein